MPLGKTDLKEGMKLLTVNNVHVNALTAKEAIKQLKDAVGKLTLTAEAIIAVNISFVLDGQRKRGPGGRTDMTVNAKMKDAVPAIFEEMNVPTPVYTRIYELVENDIQPAAIKSHLHNMGYEYHMENYAEMQMQNGAGFGSYSESLHESEIHNMVNEASKLERNVDLKAMQAMGWANAILAKYGIVANIALNATTLETSKRGNEVFSIVGLEFGRIE